MEKQYCCVACLRFSLFFCSIAFHCLVARLTAATDTPHEACKTRLIMPLCNDGDPCYRLGQNLTIGCNVTSQTECPARVKIILKSKSTTVKELLAQRVAASPGRNNCGYSYTIPSLKETDQGVYVCSAPGCPSNSLLSISGLVTIAEKPCTPEEFSCFSANFKNLVCSWRQNNYANWTMQYRLKNNFFGPRNWSKGICSNSADSVKCNSSTLITHWKKYQVEIIGKNSLGISNFTYNVTMDASLVKLDPVRSLEKANVEPRKMTLSWILSFRPGGLDGIICNCSVTEQAERGTNSVLVFSINSVRRDVRRTVPDLDPYTMYNFSVTCRPAKSIHWSDAKSALFRTLPDGYIIAGNSTYSGEECRATFALGKQLPHMQTVKFPTELPTPIEWSFSNSSKGRHIFLYMNPLPRRKWNGQELSLVLNVSREGQDVLFNQTSPGNETRTKLATQLLPNQSYHIGLELENEAGVCEISETVNVPSNQTNNYIQPGDIVVERLTNRLYQISVFETKRKSLIAYKFYQCLGPITDDPSTTPPCKTDFRQIGQETSSRSVDATVYKPPDGSKWYFGVVTKTRYAQNSLSWSTCYFYPDKSPKKPSIEVKAIGNGKVDIKLQFDFCELSERPLRYQATVQTSSRCNTSEGKNVLATPYLRLIPNLPLPEEPTSNYTACLRLYSKSSATTLSTQFMVESNIPTVKGAKTLQTIGATVGSIVLVAVVIMTALFIRYCYRRLKRRVPIDVTPFQVRTAGYTDLDDSEVFPRGTYLLTGSFMPVSSSTDGSQETSTVLGSGAYMSLGFTNSDSGSAVSDKDTVLKTGVVGADEFKQNQDGIHSAATSIKKSCSREEAAASCYTSLTDFVGERLQTPNSLHRIKKRNTVADTGNTTRNTDEKTSDPEESDSTPNVSSYVFALPTSLMTAEFDSPIVPHQETETEPYTNDERDLVVKTEKKCYEVRDHGQRNIESDRRDSDKSSYVKPEVFDQPTRTSSTSSGLGSEQHISNISKKSESPGCQKEGAIAVNYISLSTAQSLDQADQSKENVIMFQRENSASTSYIQIAKHPKTNGKVTRTTDATNTSTKNEKSTGTADLDNGSKTLEMNEPIASHFLKDIDDVTYISSSQAESLSPATCNQTTITDVICQRDDPCLISNYVDAAIHPQNHGDIGGDIEERTEIPFLAVPRGAGTVSYISVPNILSLSPVEQSCIEWQTGKPDDASGFVEVLNHPETQEALTRGTVSANDNETTTVDINNIASTTAGDLFANTPKTPNNYISEGQIRRQLQNGSPDQELAGK